MKKSPEQITAEANQHTKRVVTLKWASPKCEKAIAGAWEAGYVFACVDSSKNESPLSSVSGPIEREGWVRVEDGGYPEHLVGVLVFIPDEDYHITAGMWDISNKWVLLDEYREPECEVTHWMKCPDIPKEYHKERQEGFEAMDFLKKHLPKPPQL